MSIKVLLVTPYSFQKYGGVQNQVNLIEDYLSSHEEFEVKVFAYGKTESLDSNKVFNIPFNSSVSSVLIKGKDICLLVVKNLERTIAFL